MGFQAWNATSVFLADATTLYEVGSQAVFEGKSPPTTRPLPAAVAAVAGIPASRLQQNGVRIPPHDGHPGAVCFYAIAPTSSLVCWVPATSTWELLNCSASHVAGAITAVGNTVLVGGGYDGDFTKAKLTTLVDVLSFA